MLEEFLDRSHWHIPASFVRGFNKFFTGPFGREEELEWIKKYEDEELVGIATLQKKIRIEQRKKSLLLLQQLHEKSASEKSNNDQEELEKCERELLQARQEYWLHQQALSKLAREAPKGPWIREWELLRSIRKEHGMPLAWWEESKRCALSGGCCSRLCGCCEQPLRTYFRTKCWQIQDEH
ncbi:hypothetical protein VTN96DRAFT_9620 [Rasamsonia emersonii]